MIRKEMNGQPQLLVYKASAGSGKTWRLTVEYLKLLVVRPDAYRHILAVTFTNKAAGEMKERILNALYAFSKGEDALKNGEAQMLKTVAAETGLTGKEVCKRSAEALRLLLHDYSRFHIETIDRFFQLVLRHLARELGIGSSFNIDLDNEEILDKAVAQMYVNATNDPSVLEWIENYIEEQLRDGKSRNVGKALRSFGQNIFKECVQQKLHHLQDKLQDKDFLRNYRKQLMALRARSEHAILDALKPFDEILSREGLTPDDFAYKKSGPISYFLKLKAGDYSPAGYQSQRVQQALTDPDNWGTKNCSGHVREVGRRFLNPLIATCEKVRRENYLHILSVDLTLAHLYKVGLLSDIAAEVRNINTEENRFLLSDTGTLLNGMIDGSDAPFIFEKIGVELEHIMIDEFQDTSHTQWDNFQPLLLEGLSNGHDSLIVGDEKQSIYRFRNGDWRILGHINGQLKGIRKNVLPLSDNFRSEQVIVEFNNHFFDRAVEVLQDHFTASLQKQRADELRTAYSSIRQQCTRKDNAGMVKVTFFPPEEYKIHQLDALVHQVETLQRQGIRPDRMAILVRKNKNISLIADHFARYRQSKDADPSLCYDIVSDEAFLLSSSPGVLTLITALRVILNPDDEIALEELTRQYARARQGCPFAGSLPDDIRSRLVSLRQLPLAEMVESVCKLIDVQHLHGQESYLFAFMDALTEFATTTSSDLGEFISRWEESLCKRSVPMGTKLNGIRILSIHKSKGLQYHTVIVPFADWKLLNETRQTVWCEPGSKPYSELSLVPVDYSEKMADSVYAEDYREETLQLLIENLNTLYVAFTRAEKNLIVFSQANADRKYPSGKNTPLKTVADLLRAVLITVNHKYIQGSLYTKSGKEEKKSADISLSFHSFRHRAGFRQSNRAREFLRDGGTEGYTNRFIEYGKLMHYIFEHIRQADDIDAAVGLAVSEGLLPASEEENIRIKVRQALSHPVARRWWEEDCQLYNECSILFRSPSGELTERRPDRVIRRGDDIEVVDFKFGKPRRTYYTQVQQYMSLLHEMGFSRVKGWLWYVEDGEVQSVTL